MEGIPQEMDGYLLQLITASKFDFQYLRGQRSNNPNLTFNSNPTQLVYLSLEQDNLTELAIPALVLYFFLFINRNVL